MVERRLAARCTARSFHATDALPRTSGPACSGRHTRDSHHWQGTFSGPDARDLLPLRAVPDGSGSVWVMNGGMGDRGVQAIVQAGALRPSSRGAVGTDARRPDLGSKTLTPHSGEPVKRENRP